MKIIKKIGLLSLVVIMGGLYAPAANAVEPLTKDDRGKIIDMKRDRDRVRPLQDVSAAKKVEPLTKDDRGKIMDRIRDRIKPLQEKRSKLVEKFSEGVRVMPISKERSEQLMEIGREINNINNEIISICKEFNIDSNVINHIRW